MKIIKSAFCLLALMAASCLPGLAQQHTPEVVSIAIAPKSLSIGRNHQAHLTAVCHLDDGSSRECTKEVTWTSSNSKVAALLTHGHIKTASAGTVTITATSANGIKESATLTIR
jgi:hypothetical protein